MKFELDKGVTALISDPRSMVLLLKYVCLDELGDETNTALDKAKRLPPVLLKADDRVLQINLMRLDWLHSVVSRQYGVVLISYLLPVIVRVVEIF